MKTNKSGVAMLSSTLNVTKRGICGCDKSQMTLEKTGRAFQVAL